MTSTFTQLTAEIIGFIPVVKTPTIVDAEVPVAAAATTGLASQFTLANTPNPPASLHLYLNGIRLTSGVDYTLTGNAVAIANGGSVASNDVFGADYRF